MLESLNFVKGAASSKGGAELAHFCIKQGFITAYNGQYALGSPIAFNIDCCPHAKSFVKAIEKCKETAQLNLTPAHKLCVSSGKFRSNIEILEAPFAVPDIEGVLISKANPILPIIKKLFPFVCEDDKKPFANGMNFSDQSVFVTDNRVLIEQWHSTVFPIPVTIPRPALKEILRIGEEPQFIYTANSSVTFVYSNNRWLRTSVIAEAFPRSKLLETMAPTRTPIPPGMFKAIEELTDFLDEKTGYVYFCDGRISTTRVETLGTSIAVKGVKDGPIFKQDSLLQLAGLIDVLGVEEYPRPVPFYGEHLRGILAGVRQ